MRLPYWHSFALSLTPKQRLSLERKVYCNTSTDMVLLGVWHQNSGFLLSNNENSPKTALSETGLLQHFYWHGFALTLWMQQNSGFLLSNNENSPQTALWEKGLLQHFYWTAPKLPCERKVCFNTSTEQPQNCPARERSTSTLLLTWFCLDTESSNTVAFYSTVRRTAAKLPCEIKFCFNTSA